MNIDKDHLINCIKNKTQPSICSQLNKRKKWLKKIEYIDKKIAAIERGSQWILIDAYSRPDYISQIIDVNQLYLVEYLSSEFKEIGFSSLSQWDGKNWHDDNDFLLRCIFERNIKVWI